MNNDFVSNIQSGNNIGAEKVFKDEMAAKVGAALEVTGGLLDPTMSFNIEEGWGIIGYVNVEAYDAVDMMSPVVDDLIIMKDENGSVYWPAFGLNNIGRLTTI